MKHYSARDISVIWGISIQLVRRYCQDGKVPGAVLTDKGWMIPEGTPKPGSNSVKEEKLEAQERFRNKMDVCRLMNYHRQPNN